MMDQRMSAIEAMRLSSQENRVVHLEYSEVLAADLFADCDDTADSGDGDVVEYWGASEPSALDDGEDPQTWRVHLHR